MEEININDSSDISRTDWEALEAMTDEAIDYSEIPPLTEAFFENSTLRIPPNQAHRLIQSDPEIVEVSLPLTPNP